MPFVKGRRELEVEMGREFWVWMGIIFPSPWLSVLFGIEFEFNDLGWGFCIPMNPHRSPFGELGGAPLPWEDVSAALHGQVHASLADGGFG